MGTNQMLLERENDAKDSDASETAPPSKRRRKPSASPSKGVRNTLLTDSAESFVAARKNDPEQLGRVVALAIHQLILSDQLPQTLYITSPDEVKEVIATVELAASANLMSEAARQSIIDQLKASQSSPLDAQLTGNANKSRPK